MSAHISLAWLQLSKSRSRLLAALAGVSFTVVFSLVQLAFEDALYTSVTLLYSHLRADLVLISPRYQCSVATGGFPERRLYQALGVDGVDAAEALYAGVAQWKNPMDHRDRQIFIVGIRPDAAALDLALMGGGWNALERPGDVFFDTGSRPEFGPVAKLIQETGAVTTELAHRQVRVSGLVRIGANFAADGNVVTSDTTFFELMPNRQPHSVNLGLIRLKLGADAAAVRDRIAAALPPYVTILTRQGLMERERTFFASSLPVGLFFRTSVLMGLIVGAVIVYQILFSDISENLAEYATVKAIGYPDGYLLGVVLRQAVMLSLLGFPPGVLTAWGVLEIARRATLLPIQMSLPQGAAVYLLTLFMCAAAGLLATRKLRQADPVDVF